MRPFESKSRHASACVGASLEMLATGEFTELNPTDGKLLVSGAWLSADCHLAP